MLEIIIFILTFCNTVATAVRTFGTRQAALNHLLGQSNSSSETAANESASSLSNNGGEDGNPPLPNNNDGDNAGGATDASGPSHSEVEENRDVEMENELTDELLRGDAYSDYDLDTTKEGEAITQYLTLLTSAK